MEEKKLEAKKPQKEKTVKIMIPASRHEKDDVSVSVNGKIYQIMRGKYVEVPWFVAEALENSEREKQKAIQRVSEIKKA